MRSLILFAICTASCLACSHNSPSGEESNLESEIAFDPVKWRIKKGEDYPYRALMLNSIVYNDTIRSLTKGQLIEVLGEPDREQDDHLYYTIDQDRIGLWPLHTTTMVVKLIGPNRIEWIKIHE